MSDSGTPVEEQIELFIESLTGAAFELQVSPLETIMSIKAKVQQLEGIPISQQHLIWRAQELQDEMSLHDYDIPSGATLKLVLGMQGGPINASRASVADENSHLQEMAEYLEAAKEELMEGLPANRPLTVLLFHDGEQIRMYTVFDGQDAESPSPLSASWGSVSNRSIKENEDGWMAEKWKENQMTREKMTDLKRRMKALNLKKVPKKRVATTSTPPSNPSPSRRQLSTAGSYTKPPPLSVRLPPLHCHRMTKTPQVQSSGSFKMRYSIQEDIELTGTFERHASTPQPNTPQRRHSIRLPPITAKCSSELSRRDSLLDKRPCTADDVQAQGLIPRFGLTHENRRDSLSDSTETTKLSSQSDSPSHPPHQYHHHIAANSLPDLENFNKLDSNLIHGILGLGRAQQLITVASQYTNGFDSLPHFRHLQRLNTSPPDAFPKSPDLSDHDNMSINSGDANNPPSGFVSSNMLSGQINEELNLSAFDQWYDGRPRTTPLINKVYRPLDNLAKNIGQWASTQRLQIGVSRKNNTPGKRSKNRMSLTLSLNREAMCSLTRVVPDTKQESKWKTLPPLRVSSREKLTLACSSNRMGLGALVATGNKDITSSVTNTMKQHSSEDVQETSTGSKRVAQRSAGRPKSRESPRPFSGQKLPPILTKPKKSHKRCSWCNKKTGLATSYTCRCGKNFCATHRYAELHRCTYDYKAEGRRILQQSNPLVTAPKLPKI